MTVDDGKPRRRGTRGNGLSGKVRADGRQRVTFEFYPDTVEAIERARLKAGASSGNEVIRRSVGLLESHLDAQKAGAKAVYEYPDGTREVIRVI